MAATTGFRTFYSNIIPPGSRHINGIHVAGPVSDIPSVIAGAFTSSILNDFLLRATGIANLYGPVFNGLALGKPNSLWPIAARLYLRLNCLTSAYAPLWEEITGEPWTPEVPFRNALERQQAQNKIDAIVALSLGVTAEELCMIYRTQFPVMRRYDRENLFDGHGRLVPKQIARAESTSKFGESLSDSERTWTHPQSEVEYLFEYPFRTLDREQAFKKEFDRYSSPDFLSA